MSDFNMFLRFAIRMSRKGEMKEERGEGGRGRGEGEENSSRRNVTMRHVTN